jgi:hypothetical protein
MHALGGAHAEDVETRGHSVISDLTTEVLLDILDGRLRHVDLLRCARTCRSLCAAVAGVQAACCSADVETLGVAEHVRKRLWLFDRNLTAIRLRLTTGREAEHENACPVPRLMSSLLAPLVGLQSLFLRGLRRVDDAVVSSQIVPNLPQLRVLDLSETAVATRGVLSLQALKSLESLNITFCYMVSYTAVTVLRASCPRLTLIRRQPEWLDGHFITPWGETHTYFPCGAFSFGRETISKGWVAQIRQQGGSRSGPEGFADYKIKVDDDGEVVTTHLEDRLIFIDSSNNERPYNGRIGVAIAPQSPGRVVVLQSLDRPEPPIGGHPVLKSGEGLPEEGSTISAGSVMISRMRVLPLECTAPPPELQEELREFCAAKDTDQMSVEINAFVSCHLQDIIQGTVGSPTYLAEAINTACALIKSE